MIDLKGMISIPLLKKTAFTGSNLGVRYRLYKRTKEESDVLVAAYWIGPYCWEATLDEEKIEKEFPFTIEGIDQAVAWLNTIEA